MAQPTTPPPENQVTSPPLFGTVAIVEGSTHNLPPLAVPINIRLVEADGSELAFKVRSTTRFVKVIDAFCSARHIHPNAVRFLFDGQRLSDNDTPQQLGMQDGDIIDVALQQIGGTDADLIKDHQHFVDFECFPQKDLNGKFAAYAANLIWVDIPSL